MQTDVNADTGEQLLLSTWTTLLDLASKSSLHLTQVRLSCSSQRLWGDVFITGPRSLEFGEGLAVGNFGKRISRQEVTSFGRGIVQF
jgi:hypothetical protein